MEISKSKLTTKKEQPITNQPVSDFQVDLSKDLKTISDSTTLMQFKVQKTDNQGTKGLNTQFCPEMFYGMPSEDETTALIRSLRDPGLTD